MQEQINAPFSIKPIYWKQGWAQDSKIRKHSSSGGAAAAIETAFARGGGIVCSCVFLDGEFKFLFAKTVEEIEVFKTVNNYVIPHGFDLRNIQKNTIV